MRELIWTAGVAVAALTGTACTAGDPETDASLPAPDTVPAAAAPSAGAEGLAGRWTLVAIGGTPAGAAEPSRRPYIEFDPAGRVSGNATCNRFSGPYTVAGDSLGFGALISTKMACADSALNAQETALLSALAETRRWRLVGDTLVLGGAAGDLARFVAAGER